MVQKSRRSTGAGFTLLEVLVALAVVSIGTTVFVSLFSSSLDFARSSRSQAVAGRLAAEQLQDLRHNSTRYTWPLQNLEPKQLAEVVPSDAAKKGPHFFELPTCLPPEHTAARAQKALYEKFSWQAYVEVPSAEANYAQVTVVVRWVEGRFNRSFALTSCMPWGAVAPAKPADAAAPGGKA